MVLYDFNLQMYTSLAVNVYIFLFLEKRVLNLHAARVTRIDFNSSTFETKPY